MSSIRPISDICVQCINPIITRSIKGNCNKCYHEKWRLKNPNKVKELNKKWNPINNHRRIVFKDKIVYVKNNPRKGICTKCLRKIGEGIKRTVIHHIQYHKEDPLKDTIELCNSCHNKIHWRLRKNENEKV